MVGRGPDPSTSTVHRSIATEAIPSRFDLDDVLNVTIDASIRHPDVADTIRTTLLLLDDFLDVPQEKLPTEPSENARVGPHLQQTASE
jgi:hypothetical protein